MTTAILVIYLLTVLPDAYLWANFVRHWALVWRIVYCIPSVLIMLTPLLALFPHGQMGLFRLGVGLFLLIILPKLLFVVVSLVGKILSFAWPKAFLVANIAGLALVAIVVPAVLYGMTMGWKRVVVREITVPSARLPEAFDGYRIVQLSDFHIGTYASSPETVEKIVAKVNALNADAVVFTGDLVNLDPEEATPFLKTLAKIKAKDGVFTILGNHDYGLYRRHVAPDTPACSLARLVAKEDSMGWTLLRNDHRILRRGADSIALTLSGHTHAMQLRLLGFSPSQFMYKEWGGLYTEDQRHLHVSTGIGSNIPFRLGAWPEVDVLTLERRMVRSKG